MINGCVVLIMKPIFTLLATLLLAPLAALHAADLNDLTVFKRGFPHTIFFRNAESLAVENMPVKDFDTLVSGYDGMIVKAFDEEKYGLSKYALPYFRGYKQRHPGQLLLLHFNGQGRDPRPLSASPEFFAGHWLHYNGCRILSDLLPASAEVRVENPGLFQLAIGKQHRLPDDVTICALKSDGTPDWLVYEYAKVVAIDQQSKRLTVKRGAFGSKAREWKTGQAYIAAIVPGGSFPMAGDTPQTLWTYNFSLDAPRDARGRRLIEVLADDLAAKLNPGGPGDFFDGLEFDVMPCQPPQRFPKHMQRLGRGQDTDGDGKPDFGVRDGVNRYGAGVEEFLRRLRERLGSNRLILRDAGRRAGPVLNGIESEGWPTPFDLETSEWSSGMNDHAFCWARSAKPPLVYLHYKYANRREGQQNEPVHFPLSRSRLILAAAQILGDAVTTNNGPKPEAGEQYGLFDELKMGVARRRNWLGQPVETPRALALATPDLLRGAGCAMNAAFRQKISAPDTLVEFTPTLKATAKDPKAVAFSFTLAGVPLAGSDVLLSLRVKADPMRGMPPDTARRVTITPIHTDKGFSSSTTPSELWTWADGEWFEARFYYRGLNGRTADFMITVEDATPFYLADMKVFAHPDVVAREFENGLVLANPSLQPYTFDLQSIYPGHRFRRLQGSAAQHPQVNNGQPVGATVTLDPRDGLFLIREE
jgi:hypothetical protein